MYIPNGELFIALLTRSILYSLRSKMHNIMFQFSLKYSWIWCRRSYGLLHYQDYVTNITLKTVNGYYWKYLDTILIFLEPFMLWCLQITTYKNVKSEKYQPCNFSSIYLYFVFITNSVPIHKSHFTTVHMGLPPPTINYLLIIM